MREVKKGNQYKFITGTGFFFNCKQKKIKLFITNNHVLDKDFLDKENKLVFFIATNGRETKNEINLENRYKFTDKV